MLLFLWVLVFMAAPLGSAMAMFHDLLRSHGCDCAVLLWMEQSISARGSLCTVTLCDVLVRERRK